MAIIKKFQFEPIDYDPLWPTYFVGEADRILGILGKEIVRLHHVGSTAIPGMLAKPIIDILGEVKDVDRVATYAPIMELLGYEFKGGFGIKGRAYFQNEKQSFGKIAYHLHFFKKGSFEVEKHLLFRDFLKANPESAEKYMALKRDLLSQFPDSRDDYQNGKADLIYSLTMEAFKWRSVT